MSLIMQEKKQVKTIQILLVEDEAMIAEYMQVCLNYLGYTVVGVAETAESALKKVAETHPDIVLMDIQLKGEIDGIQAAAKIWEFFQIPIIYTTASSNKKTLERVKKSATFGYLLKPIKERELYVSIEMALRRYQMDKELEEKAEWLDTIFKSIGDGVIVVDRGCRVKFLNQQAELMTGWKQEKAVGKSLTRIFKLVNEKTRSPIEAPAKKVIDTGKQFDLEPDSILISKSTAEIPIDDSAAPLKNSQGEIIGCVIIFRDITERKLVEERNLALERAKQLELKMAELQRLNQLKDDFLCTVSHELRSPISNIQIATQMLEILIEKQTDSPNKTVRFGEFDRYFQILQDECKQQLHLVNDLLDLQHLNANTYILNPEKIHLPDLIYHIAEAFEATLQSSEQALKLNIPSDLAPLISDLSSLTRIIRELLNNACKYTPSGECIAISAAILCRSDNSQSKQSVELCFTNFGVEICNEELPHVFDKFYRIPTKDPWKRGGTGLGLALVKNLVNYLGGSIRAESSEGRVCFILEIPLHLTENL